MGHICYLKIVFFSIYLSIIGFVVHGASTGKYSNNTSRRAVLMSKSLPFEDCGSEYSILYLDVSSCTSIPCVMNRGSYVEVKLLFDDDNNNTIYLKHHVRWIFNAIKTEAYITPDYCDGVHNCFSKDDEGKLYWAIVVVNNSLPAISGTMLWETVNEFNREVLCFKIPVVVVTK